MANRTEGEAESGEFQFEVDAGLLVQLGEQLVARRSVALAELIKNAYDADATKVTVLLENVTCPGGTIIVEDNGTGMTFEQVRDYWMRIATNSKVRNPISPIYGRPRTGAKGIGRFAARRLANKLALHSVAMRNDGIKERILVEFDWKKNFKVGQTLTEIPITYERLIVADDTPTGVMLYLEDARDVWTERDIVDFQKDLFTLTNPFPQEAERLTKTEDKYKTDPGFSFDLEVPEYPEHAGELGERFLAAALIELTGYVGEEGSAHYHLAIRKPEDQLNFKPADEQFDGLDVRFRIHYFVYSPDFFAEVPFGVRDAQKMGREQGGVRVYLDGFRVFPYGDPGDDWLQLDEVRSARTRRLLDPTEELRKMESDVSGRPWLLTPGNNQVFGAVAISRLKHSGIEVNVSRERLVENEAFDQLRRFVQLGIYWMTLQYARVTSEERERRRVSRAYPQTVQEIIVQAQDTVRASEDIPDESQREILQVLDYAKERAHAEKEELISELSLIRVLSSTGTMAAMLDHQLRAVIEGIRAIHTDLVEFRPKVSFYFYREFDQILAQIQDWREMVTRQVTQLGFLLGKKARKRRRRLPLREAVDNVTKPLSLYRRDFGIGFENLVPPNLKTPPIFEAELHAVFLHIFTNALKAVRTSKVRQIAVKAERESDGVHIFMLDTGGGIEPGRREDVFRPFVTFSSPDPILGVGTGLGLKIVRDILENYDGTARFVDVDRFAESDVQWRTCIEIVLPERR
jgi:signal transduction histidine kinase